MCARGIVIITRYIVDFCDSSWRKITLAVSMPGLLSAARLLQQSDIKMLVIKMFFVHLCRLQNLFKDTKFDHTLAGHCNTRGQTSNLLWLPPFIFGPTCHAYVALQGRVLFFLFTFFSLPWQGQKTQKGIQDVPHGYCPHPRSRVLVVSNYFWHAIPSLHHFTYDTTSIILFSCWVIFTH